MRGDGSVYKRGNIWWMSFYRDGRQVLMSCKTESEQIARAKLRKVMRMSDDEFSEPKFRRVTIGELVTGLLEHYDTQGKTDFRADTKSRWEHHLSSRYDKFKAYLFCSTQQKQYRTERLEEGATNTTINRELQVLRKAFRLGADQEPPLVKRVPKFHIMREENARRGFANRSQIEALKKAAAQDSLGMRALIEAAHMLGWRRGELLNLRVKNVNLADGTVRIETSKNGEPRETPMTATLRTLLEALVVGRKPDERVFPTESYVRKVWPQLTAAAGCPTLIFHDLRRTSARSKRAAGVDQTVIMDMHGWKTPEMFGRYGIVATEDKVAALAKQEAYEAKPN
jgi:integrase